MKEKIQKLGQSKQLRYVGLGCLIVIMFLIPLVVKSRYWLHLFVLMYIWGIAVVSLNILVGYRGVLCLATSGFMAVGAYTSALLCMNLSLTPWLSIPLSMVLSGVVGLILGLATARLPASSLITAALAFRTIIQVTLNNWVSLTRGPMGINNITGISLLPGSALNRAQYCWLSAVFFLLVVIVTRNITSSPTGRALRGMRDNVDLARALGVNQFRFDVTGFAIVGVLSGLAGGLYAHYIRTIDPTLAGFTYMSQMTTMVVSGGRGTVAGPILGAVVYTFLPELLREFDEWRQIFYGLSIVLIILFMPDGLASIPQLIRDRHTKRQQQKASKHDGA